MSTKPNTRLTEYERSHIKDKCHNLLMRRRILVHRPWDSSPYKFYFNLLPTDLKAAVTLINEKMEGNFKKMLNFESSGSVTLRDSEHHMVIRWRGEKPTLNSGWSDDGALNLSERHPRYDDIANFCNYANAIDNENDSIGVLVKHVVDTCNTFGQIHRVWPDLLPTIGGEKVAAAEGQQRKSQLPEDLEADRILLTRDDATTKLAQATLLSDLPAYFSWIL